MRGVKLEMSYKEKSMTIIADTLNCYQVHLVLIKKMWECVSQEKWESLEDLQVAYDRSSNTLINFPDLSSHILSEAEQTEFHHLISQINEQQQNLNRALLLRRQQLGQLIHDTVSQRSQIKHYYDVADLI